MAACRAFQRRFSCAVNLGSVGTSAVDPIEATPRSAGDCRSARRGRCCSLPPARCPAPNAQEPEGEVPLPARRLPLSTRQGDSSR